MAYMSVHRERDVLYDNFKGETSVHGLGSMAAARGNLTLFLCLVGTNFFYRLKRTFIEPECLVCFV